MDETLVVNLFGGPGTGKSTTAAGLFYLMKLKGINCELVRDFAKDLVWAERFAELSNQPYIFGEQVNRVKILVGKVEVVVTDSPILLSAVYNLGNDNPHAFNQGVIDTYNTFNNLNVFLVRTKAYSPIGRRQSEESARGVDEKIHRFLLDNRQDHYRIVADNEAPTRILEMVEASRKPKEKEEKA